MSRSSFLLALCCVTYGCGGEKATPVTVAAPVAVGADAGAAPATASRSLDFGSLECGALQKSAVALPNATSAPISWRASVQPTEYFALEGVIDGVVPPGDSQLITVRATAVATKVKPGEPVNGVVRIETDDPRQRVIEVAARFVPEGARLEAIAQHDFGLIPTAAPTTVMPLALRNVGTRSLQVALDNVIEGPFKVTAPSAIVDLDPAEKAEAAIEFRPGDEGAHQAEIPIELRGNVCGEKSFKLTLSGASWGGPIAITPGSLDFGSSACGTAPAPKTVTLTNYAAAEVPWTASLANLWFKVTPAFGALQPGQSTAIEVTRVAAPPMRATDTLKIAVGNRTHAIPIAHQSTGPIVRSLSGEPFKSADQRLASTGTRNLELVNEGLDPVTLTPAISGTDEFATSTLPITVSPNGSVSLPIAFKPSALGDREATLSIGGATCGGGTMEMLLRGYGFARATSIWANHRSASYIYSAPFCVALDDRSLFCDSIIGQAPPGATLLDELLDGYRCYRPASSTVPYCHDGYSAGFAPRTDYQSVKQRRSSYTVLDDGRLLENGTEVANLVDVRRVLGTDYAPCVIRDGGSIECWGTSSMLSGMAGTAVTTRPVAERHAVSDISDAIDAHFAGYYYYGREELWTVHASGKVSVLYGNESGAFRETVVGIDDAVEVRGLGTDVLVRRSSGLVSYLSLAGGKLSATLVPLSNVVAIGVEIRSVSRWNFVRSDGRMFHTPSTSSMAVTAKVGFDR